MVALYFRFGFALFSSSLGPRGARVSMASGAGGGCCAGCKWEEYELVSRVSTNKGGWLYLLLACTYIWFKY